MDDLSGTGDADVDRVVGSIRNRLAVAESQLSQLEQRSLSQGETPEVLKRKELEDQLEARKARLGLAEPPAPVAIPAPAPEAAPAPAPVVEPVVAPEAPPALTPDVEPVAAPASDPAPAPEAPLSA